MTKFGVVAASCRIARADEPGVRVHLHLVAHLAAKSRVRRHVVVLARDVPARDLDAGERAPHHRTALPVAVAVDLEEHALDLERIASDDEALVVRDASLERHLLGAERRLAPAVEPFVRLDLDERPVGAEGVERVDLDVGDFHLSPPKCFSHKKHIVHKGYMPFVIFVAKIAST